MIITEVDMNSPESLASIPTEDLLCLVLTLQEELLRRHAEGLLTSPTEIYQ